MTAATTTISTTALRTLEALRELADETHGLCWARRASISTKRQELSGEAKPISVRSVSYHLAALEAAGCIRRFRYWRGPGRDISVVVVLDGGAPGQRRARSSELQAVVDGDLAEVTAVEVPGRQRWGLILNFRLDWMRPLRGTQSIQGCNSTADSIQGCNSAVKPIQGCSPRANCSPELLYTPGTSSESSANLRSACGEPQQAGGNPWTSQPAPAVPVAVGVQATETYSPSLGLPRPSAGQPPQADDRGLRREKRATKSATTTRRKEPPLLREHWDLVDRVSTVLARAGHDSLYAGSRKIVACWAATVGVPHADRTLEAVEWRLEQDDAGIRTAAGWFTDLVKRDLDLRDRTNGRDKRLGTVSGVLTEAQEIRFRAEEHATAAGDAPTSMNQDAFVAILQQRAAAPAWGRTA